MLRSISILCSTTTNFAMAHGLYCRPMLLGPCLGCFRTGWKQHHHHHNIFIYYILYVCIYIYVNVYFAAYNTQHFIYIAQFHCVFRLCISMCCLSFNRRRIQKKNLSKTIFSKPVYIHCVDAAMGFRSHMNRSRVCLWCSEYFIVRTRRILDPIPSVWFRAIAISLSSQWQTGAHHRRNSISVTRTRTHRSGNAENSMCYARPRP